MAWLIQPDGTETVFELGDTPSRILRQLQAAVRGYIEIVARAPDGQLLLMDEEGSFKAEAQTNHRAVALTAQFLGVDRSAIAPLVGPAVVLSAAEVSAWETPNNVSQVEATPRTV